MSKLLAAGFARLKKDKMFWIGIAFVVFMGLFVPVRNYLDAMESGFKVPFDNYFFGYTLFTFHACVFEQWSLLWSQYRRPIFKRL